SDTAGDWTTPIPFGRGPEGPKGPQGDRGERGPQGLVGPQGEQGPEGERGPTGTQGPTGSQGARGPEGPKGVQGDKGLDGAQGATGIEGARGPEGPMGVQGDKGIDGQQGPQGLRGPEGQKGVQGDKGIDGQQGPQGVAGPTGPQGPEGARGDDGFQGPAGPQGPVGPMGAQGDKGPNGQAGERGSRAFYEAVSAVTWNQGLVDRFFGPTAAYPYAVDYDLFVQYNASKGYSETRIFRQGAWQTAPVNLVQDFINKIANGVSSTNLQYGKVTEALNLGVPHYLANDYVTSLESGTVFMSKTTAINGLLTQQFRVKGNGAKVVHIRCRVLDVTTNRLMSDATETINVNGIPYDGVLGYAMIHVTFPISATLLETQGGGLNFKLAYSITSDDNVSLAKMNFNSSGSPSLVGIKTIV
ncbi:MAG: hypothetical protein ACRC0J_18045, partial [Shewanella oncorhynchi]